MLGYLPAKDLHRFLKTQILAILEPSIIFKSDDFWRFYCESRKKRAFQSCLCYRKTFETTLFCENRYEIAVYSLWNLVKIKPLPILLIHGILIFDLLENLLKLHYRIISNGKWDIFTKTIKEREIRYWISIVQKILMN